MNYKKFLNAVSVAAVVVVFSVGCTNTDVCPVNEEGEPISGCPTSLCTLTIAATSGGSVYPSVGSHRYGEGDSVTVTATAYSGYTFSNWSGASSSTNAKIRITMDSDKTLTANFQQDTTTDGEDDGSLNKSNAKAKSQKDRRPANIFKVSWK